MAHGYPSFWLELSGKIGPPVVAATLVGCLLANKFELLHGILLAGGIVLIWLSHWQMRKEYK